MFLAATTALPLVAPTTGWRHRFWLGLECYVRPITIRGGGRIAAPECGREVLHPAVNVVVAVARRVGPALGCGKGGGLRRVRRAGRWTDRRCRTP